jgi:hypothetical protein
VEFPPVVVWGYSAPQVNEFSRALQANPAPSALGDVRLRYAPSMLIGETEAGRRSWRPWALSLLGGALIALAVGSLVSSSRLEAVAALAMGGAWAFWASVRLSRLERQRRAFVVNFATTTLRLDFSSPIAGQPRTLVVPFEAVKAVTLLDQADGAQCLTVDVERDGARLCEVLVAHVTPGQREAAGRLRRVLEGAFGLGLVPPTSPYLETQGDGRPGAALSTPPRADATAVEPPKPE